MFECICIQNLAQWHLSGVSPFLYKKNVNIQDSHLWGDVNEGNIEDSLEVEYFEGTFCKITIIFISSSKPFKSYNMMRMRWHLSTSVL